MRFRAKFGLLGCCYLAMPLILLILLLSRRHHATMFGPWFVAIWTAIALLRMLSHIRVYWEIIPEGLHERRFWTERTIPWNEIHSAGPWPDGKPMHGNLAIDFVRPAPLSSQGRVIASPDRLDDFLQELRRHAPQVHFAMRRSGSVTA